MDLKQQIVCRQSEAVKSLLIDKFLRKIYQILVIYLKLQIKYEIFLKIKNQKIWLTTLFNGDRPGQVKKFTSNNSNFNEKSIKELPITKLRQDWSRRGLVGSVLAY